MSVDNNRVTTIINKVKALVNVHNVSSGAHQDIRELIANIDAVSIDDFDVLEVTVTYQDDTVEVRELYVVPVDDNGDGG